MAGKAAARAKAKGEGGEGSRDRSWLVFTRYFTDVAAVFKT